MKHSRSIAKSNIFLASHLFYKFHELGNKKNKTSLNQCTFEKPYNSVFILKSWFKIHYLHSQTFLPYLRGAENEEQI